jgi:putative addiction module component (TIGR02574 family)
MSGETQEMLDRALKLSEGDRALLIDELLSSIDEAEEAIDARWQQEVEDRLQAYRDGKLSTVSLEQVLAKYQK